MSLSGLLGALGLTAGGGLLVGEAYDKLGDVGDTAWEESQNIGDAASAATQFTGYGVTGPVGQSQIDASGNLSTSLSDVQQNYADAMRRHSLGAAGPNSPLGQYGRGALGTAGSLFDTISQGSDGREQYYYDQIRAMQTPEEQRQRLSLESRLASQGRTGVRSAMYGGTPEQLAMEKAQAEAQNTASVQAIELARQQQMQNAQIAGMLGQSGAGALGAQGSLAGQYGQLQYAPQSALLDLLGAGTQAYGYEDIARRQGANQYAEAYMGGLEGLLGSRLGQANLMGQVGTAFVGAGGDAIGDYIGGLFRGR